MELDDHLLAEIAAIFRMVKYGRVTFFLSPDKKTLDYSVETTGKLPLSGHHGISKSKPDSRLTKSLARA